MTRPPIAEKKVSPGLVAENAALMAPPNDATAAVPGSTRLSLAIGYFGLMAWLMGLISTGMLAALLFPQLGWDPAPGKQPYLSLATAVILTFGFARTRKLLRLRSRMGGLLAISMFAIGLIEDFVAGSPRWGAIAFSALGIILVTSIWQYLDDDEQ